MRENRGLSPIIQSFKVENTPSRRWWDGVALPVAANEGDRGGSPLELLSLSQTK